MNNPHSYRAVLDYVNTVRDARKRSPGLAPSPFSDGALDTIAAALELSCGPSLPLEPTYDMLMSLAGSPAILAASDEQELRRRYSVMRDRMAVSLAELHDCDCNTSPHLKGCAIRTLKRSGATNNGGKK